MVSDSTKADKRTVGWRRGDRGHTREEQQTHIVFLAETEEAADLARALGSETLGVYGIRHAGDIGIALLDNGQGQHGQVHADNATSDTLPLALSSSSWAVAAVALGEEEAYTGWVHDTLLHRETLLVVATGDLEDVPLELVADAVAGNLLAHAAVHEDAQLAVILDFDQLLGAVGREGDVELHLGGDGATIVDVSFRRIAVVQS